MKINRTDLYYECIETKKGFELWPEWIEKKVTEIIIKDVYNKQRKMREPKAKQVGKRKSTKIELLGAVKFVDNYFKKS